MKFENRNLSIENIKNDIKSILGIHKAEIKQYKKDKEKQRQEDKKKQEIPKPVINNYNDYDYKIMTMITMTITPIIILDGIQLNTKQ